MEPARQNNSINAINDARMLLNEVRNNLFVKKQRELERNSL